MSKPEVQTKIADGGLRYMRKQNGSMFGASVHSDRSCIYCGQHRSPSQRKTVRMLGRNEVACEPPCPKSPRKRDSSYGRPCQLLLHRTFL